ncbi:response regulator transcription factor [Culicoidibacter larvae]|uniref:Response regulator transcription factor n=1 Tax=Culicoidibacter larvae TaxID=2579976 RepID=A0A5R8QAP6_9FIRM|nr:response regulator transcription factor [Culicoidibacter larvae]TLG72729.1 response regulator transcription factor [Culicoidibacter larvae]
MTKILFVEDDMQYRQQIQEVLVQAGYEVRATESPIEALDLFQDESYDLVITDYMMPAMSGVQLMRYLKRIDTKVKTIILTGIDSADVEISALDNSVDQYLHKGVREDVLVKYVERVLKDPIKLFAAEEDAGILKSMRENITIHLNNYEVFKDGVKVDVTFKEYQLLVYFIKHMGQVLERDKIIDDIWSDSKDEITSRVVDTQVKLLRKKLRLNAVQSIRNVGYRWNE